MPEAPALPAYNRLGLDYREAATRLPYQGPIIDVHTHVTSPEAAEIYLEAAATYGVVKTFTMTGIGPAREVARVSGDAIEFMVVPDFLKRDRPGTFTSQWLDDIRAFRGEFGSRVLKLWVAPRGIDLAAEAPGLEPGDLRLDSTWRRRGMDLAYDLGYRVFMTHVADPDTWFRARYTDTAKYGTKRDQYVPLEKLMREFDDVTWIGAHMGGTPEDLDFLQGLLDRHPNYVVDCSACKWQVRELSKHPQRLAELVRANPGRVLFGSDIVASKQMDSVGFDLFCSRWWALRTLLETDYDGPSPIVDPDLHMVDPSVPEDATAHLRGAALGEAELRAVYHDNVLAVLPED